MRLRQLTAVVLVLTLTASAFLGSNLQRSTNAQTKPDVYVGIDVAYGDMDAIKELVNEVSTYTNLFIIGCTAITHNETRLDETCQYLYDKGLSFIVYQEWPFGYGRNRWLNVTASNWTESAKIRWGDYFLGLNYLDEPGGRQLDNRPGWIVVNNPENGEDAAYQFNLNVSRSVNWFRAGYSDGTDVSLFVSDYALYWFDYKAGYDTLLTQFGWNYSRQLNVALCRGAATAQNKDWGAIITWTYTESPYIGSGEELYNDMLLAYNNGAKYIVIFDSNEEYTQSILQEEHFNALEQFWQYIQNNAREENPVELRTALVLPKGYAYGFRGPADKIWGEWYANEFAYHLSVDVYNLLEQYGTRLDIIYDDELQSSDPYGYGKLIWWNDTSLMPSISSTANLLPSQTPSASSTPTYTLSLSPNISSTPANSTPTQKPIPTQDTQDGQNLFSSYAHAVAAGGVIIGTAVVAIFLKRRRHF